METTNAISTRTQVVSLSKANYSVREIADMLDISEGTVSYHRANEKNGVVAQAPRTIAEPDAQAYGHIEDMTLKVKTMSRDKYSVRGIAKALKLSESAVSYHRAKPPVVVQLNLEF